VGGGSSFEKFQSETVKIFDIQTLCFGLIKDPTSIPAGLINKPNKTAVAATRHLRGRSPAATLWAHAFRAHHQVAHHINGGQKTLPSGFV
jgi:hypothetical protein